MCPLDFRFLLRMDRNQCGKKLIEAMETGLVQIELFDKSNIYTVESMYKVWMYKKTPWAK